MTENVQLAAEPVKAGGNDMILDIGANEGEFALALAQRNPDLQVLAIEPIPILAGTIKARASALGCHNLSCQQIAVDEESRLATFHIADQADRGVSSLLSFDRESITANDYWKHRSDLHFSYDLKVQVCRLDEILADAPPDRIRFIKIDAQGVDLAVLRSLGSLLGRVEAGMLEVPATVLTRLYTEENVDLLAVLSFLHENGFDVHALKPNDPATNEFNVIFHRRGMDWRAVEQDLHLRGVHLYDGKHFWHLPSDHLLHPEGELAAAQADLQRHIDLLRAATDEIARLHPLATALEAEVAGLRSELAIGAERENAKALELCSSAYQAALEAQQEVARMRVAQEHMRSTNQAIQLELEEGRRQLAVRRHENQALRNEIHELNERILNLYRSSSWRVTGPIRRIVRVIRRCL